MGRPSTVSLHPERAQIENQLSAGAPVPAVSAQSGIAQRSLFRTRAQLQAEARAEAEHAHALHVGSIAAELADVVTELRALRDAARESGDRRAAVAAARAQIGGLTALADRLGIASTEAVQQLSDANALVSAVRAVLPHYDRSIAARLAQEVGNNGGSLALVDAIRLFASRIQK